jgi:hypothetical protein
VVRGTVPHLSLVDASINGKGPFRFIFDTGASGLVVNSSVAKTLKLKDLGEVKVGSPADPEGISARLVLVDKLKVRDAVFENVIATSIPESDAGAGLGTSGILGMNLFRECLFTLDFQKERIELRPGELGPPDNKHIIAYTPEFNLAKIDLRVSGKTISTCIDSGSPDFVMFPKKNIDTFKLKGKPVLLGQGQTIDGTFQIFQATLDGTIEVAGHKFKNPVITINDYFPFPNIGYKFLKDFRVTFDQKNHRLQILSKDKISDNSLTK